MIFGFVIDSLWCLWAAIKTFWPLQHKLHIKCDAITNGV